MMEVKMVARTVGVSDALVVAQLEAIPDHEDDTVPGGNARIIVRDPDAFDQFEQGMVYNVTFTKASKADAGVHAQTTQLAAQVAAIQNSTNTAGYKTPPELKVPPPQMPDGTVTLPRPSVVLAPVTTTPGDAGVVSGPPFNPTPAASTPTTATTTTPQTNPSPGQSKK